MNVSIIGTGYVGLVTGISLAVKGNRVICVGRDKEKINAINRGAPSFYEPGLTGLLKKVLLNQTFSATHDIRTAVLKTDVTLIAVGTPTVKGKIDLSSMKDVVRKIGRILKKKKSYHVVVIKSTVLPTSTETVIRPILEESSGKKTGKNMGLCANPEFLREGNAIEDSLKPDRIVIGTKDLKSYLMVKKIYAQFDCPILMTSFAEAEMIKYASNSLLATLISFSNEIALICESINDADAENIWRGVHLDRRLTSGKKKGPEVLAYIRSGCGYGGSCFPKDTQALSAFAQNLKIDSFILKNVIHTNSAQFKRLIAFAEQKIGKLKGKKISVFGLAFKPNTDDLRESPSLKIMQLLLKKGACVFCHDPIVSKKQLKNYISHNRLEYRERIKDALDHADAAIFVTSWDIYKKFSPTFLKKHMNTPVVIDGRRIFDRRKFLKQGIIYQGIGHKS